MEDSHHMTQARIGLIAGYSAKWEDGGEAKVTREIETTKAMREAIARKTGEVEITDVSEDTAKAIVVSGDQIKPGSSVRLKN